MKGEFPDRRVVTVGSSRRGNFDGDMWKRTVVEDVLTFNKMPEFAQFSG